VAENLGSGQDSVLGSISDLESVRQRDSPCASEDAPHRSPANNNTSFCS
jgi:hypothetical protein